MNTIKNDNSLLGEKEIVCEEVLRLENVPIRMGVTDEDENNDIFANMIFNIDKKTGMVQLGELIPQGVLYGDAHYNNIAQNWKEHHKAFAEFVFKYHPKSVFEIGGGTGMLSCCYDVLDKIQWTILESAPNPIEGCRAEYKQGIFDEHYKIQSGYDAIIHTHTMEHFYNPLDVVKHIGELMPIGSYMFFSVPNLEEMYKRNYTNVMNFEHTFLCIEPYISNILNLSGYEILEKELFKEEHSVFYAARRTADVEVKYDYTGCYEKNKRIILGWAEYHNMLIKAINESLERYDNHKIYLFGAHAYAQFLIIYGLNVKNIECILDNDPAKQGHRLYGTKFQVCSTDVLQKDDEPVVILHAGTHDEEIKKGIRKKNITAIFV